MDGARDYEVAMGGYQPYHLATKHVIMVWASWIASWLLPQCKTFLNPIAISEGNVTQLQGFQFFPYTKAPVLGAKSGYMPPVLTT